MEEKLISVILPNYNDEKFLKGTIESVLNQNYKNIELIIVDDCSTDNSKKVIESFDDPRIVSIFLNKNEHIVNALNIGLNKAKGEYIARIDSGDEYEKDKFTKQIKYMQENEDCGACFTWCTLIDNKGNIVNEKNKDFYNLVCVENKPRKEWIKFFINNGNCLIHSSVLFKKEVYKNIGEYDIAFVQAQDMEMWARIAVKYPIHVIKESLVKYRWDTEDKDRISMPNKGKSIRFYNERVLMIEKLMNNIDNKDFLELFEDDLINKNVNSKLEIECEKAFILYKKELSKILGFKILIKLFNTDGGREVLEKKYNFGLKDLYELDTKSFYYDDIIKGEISALKNDLECKESEILELTNTLNEEKQNFNKIINKKDVDIKALEDGIINRNNELFRIKNSKALKTLKLIKRTIKGNNNPKPKFIMPATPDYGNLGDHLLQMIRRKFLEDYFKGYEIIETSVRGYNEQRSLLIAGIGQNDYILLPGGGSLGNEYLPFAENYVRDIMNNFKYNKIIIFPQTIYFTKDEQGKQEEENTKRIYNQCKDLTICLREEKSFKKGKEMFPSNNVIKIPDIALYANAYPSKERIDSGLLILRGDHESLLKNKDKENIENIAKNKAKLLERDDTQKDYFIDIKDREKEVNNFLDKISKYKFIVTDRIHGMVIAAITNTPCVAMDNHSSKVKGTYEFIKYLPYISYIDDINDLDRELDKVLKVKNCTYTNKPLMEYYDKLAKVFNLGY